MSAANYDLVVDQGSTFAIDLTVKVAGVAKDLTGYAARAKIKSSNGKNKISSSQMVVTERENPFYYKVIPEPPKIKPHIVQIDLHEIMTEWWFNAKAEIDHQLAKIRNDYSAEGSYDDTEEDEDDD